MPSEKIKLNSLYLCFYQIHSVKQEESSKLKSETHEQFGQLGRYKVVCGGGSSIWFCLVSPAKDRARKSFLLYCAPIFVIN